MLDRDLQHPDITAIERTGYPIPIKPRIRLEFTLDGDVIEVPDEEFEEIVARRKGAT